MRQRRRFRAFARRRDPLEDQRSTGAAHRRDAGHCRAKRGRRKQAPAQQSTSAAGELTGPVAADVLRRIAQATANFADVIDVMEQVAPTAAAITRDTIETIRLDLAALNIPEPPARTYPADEPAW